MNIIRHIGRGIRWVLRWIRYALYLLLFLFLVQRSSYPGYLDWNAIALAVAEYKFDYVSWEVDALWSKTTQALWGQHHYMDEATRSQFVIDYMADLDRVRHIEAELDRLFLEDPGADVRDLKVERDSLRDSLGDRQTTTEAILEGQVAAVLVDAGFGTMGQLFPPVSMRFTQMPNLLVVSPRDRIDRSVELALDYLPLEERQRVERRVEDVRDVSALVVPLGGMALFPAMIQESAHLPWVVETFAHEWIHHYFFFFPLGLSYFIDTGQQGLGEAIIINETTADIFGEEIAAEVLARYYPAYVQAAASAQPVAQGDENTFDFGRAMHVTRVIVDSYMDDIAQLNAANAALHPLDDAEQIAANQAVIDRLIDNVERYMAYRQGVFWANGYRIRRINQAYFAFYGGYQGGIPGIGGEDPIGPAVRAIRTASPDVHQFAITMRSITTRAELLDVAAPFMD